MFQFSEEEKNFLPAWYTEVSNHLHSREESCCEHCKAIHGYEFFDSTTKVKLSIVRKDIRVFSKSADDYFLLCQRCASREYSRQTIGTNKLNLNEKAQALLFEQID